MKKHGGMTRDKRDALAKIDRLITRLQKHRRALSRIGDVDLTLTDYESAMREWTTELSDIASEVVEVVPANA